MPVAVITGAGRGIGRALAFELAAHGWTTALAARSETEIAETAALIGASALAIRADVRDEDSVRHLMTRTDRELGPIDLLVNNAGAPGFFGPTWEADPAVWWEAFETNMRGTFLCCHAALPAMVARRRGRIVNVASGAGLMSIPNMSAYVSSKAAVIRFTETLAREVKPHGISAFSIQPGTIRTRMAETLLASNAAKYVPFLADIFKNGQDETPEKAAALVSYLASGRGDARSGEFIDASSWVE